MFWKGVVRCLSRGGGQGKLFVFIFHRILARPDPLLSGEPDRDQFGWMVRFISRAFTVLPFVTAVELLKRNQLPPAAASITFDDGYRDNFTVALPVLREHGVTGTFFIATGFLGGGRMWNDDVIEAVRVSSDVATDWREFGLGVRDFSTLQGRCHGLDAALTRLKYFPHEERAALAREIARRAGVPDESDFMMSSHQVRELRAAGMEIGAHTRTHPILSELGDVQARDEICGGKAELESILGAPVDVFAYPNGNPERDLTSRDVKLVKEAGFRAAATTAWGVARPQTDAFLMPRFTPWDRTYNRFAARVALTLAR